MSPHATLAASSGYRRLGPAHQFGPHCTNGAWAVPDSVVIRGFAGCGNSDLIQYTEGDAGRWVLTPTSYHGIALAAADDGATTFLLFKRGSDGLPMLGRRGRDGSYGDPVQLSDAAVTGTPSINGTSCLIARAGAWRAIWAEDIAPQSAAAVLYEAGSGFQRRQVTKAVQGRETSPSADVRTTDGSVRLAYQVEDPAGHWRLVLSTAPSMTAKFSTARNLVGAASTELDPQLATDGDYTYLAFLDEKVPTLGELPSPDAPMSRHGFYSLTGGMYVHVAVSAHVPVIAWEAPRGAEGDGSDIDMAENRAGHWYEQRAAAPPDYVYALPLHLSSRGSRATVIYLQDGLIERTE